MHANLLDKILTKLCNDSGNLAKSSGMHKKDRIEKGESGETAKTIPMPCFPGSMLHLGIFPDHTDFQIWRVTFRTEVCSKAKNPRLAMQWIKKIETAKSIDDLISPKSITGKDFPDHDELDMMMASALKKCYDKQTHFRKKVSIEEPRAQKKDRFLRERHIAFYDLRPLFVQEDSMKRYKAFQDCSVFQYSIGKTMISKILTCDWEQALLSTSG